MSAATLARSPHFIAFIPHACCVEVLGFFFFVCFVSYTFQLLEIEASGTCRSEARLRYMEELRAEVGWVVCGSGRGLWDLGPLV